MSTPKEDLLKLQRIHAFDLLLKKAEDQLVASLQEKYLTEGGRIASHRLLAAAELRITQMQKHKEYFAGAVHLLTQAREEY